MPDVLRFVSAIDPSRTTRLDLNDQTTWFRRTANFGMPPVVRAEVATMLMDGERYPSSRYGNRTIQLSLYVAAANADAVATQIQALQRQLDRPQNILEWRRSGATHPVFFKTFRTAPDSIEEFVEEGRKFVTVEVTAEPFAYGLRETLSAVTVNDDPAAALNGMFLDVTGVKGDVETPAFLEYPAVSTSQQLTLIAVRRRGTPSQMPFLLQAESMTAFTDTSIQANDLAFSGTGQNWMRCTFATDASLVLRLRASGWPTLSGPVDYRGTYRVFARVRRNSATSTSMALQLKWGQLSSVAGSVVTSWNGELAGDITLVDLGKVAIPSSADPVMVGPSGSEIPVRGLSRVELWAQRVSGTANLDIDFLLFTPADDALLMFDHASGSGATTAVVDGYNETVYYISTGTLVNTSSTQITGRFPMLSPGETNRIVFCRNVGAGPSTVTETTSVIVSYWPRYVYVKPATT